MASPEEIVQWLPDTLPEDFSEWDSDASSAPAPAKSGGVEAAHVLKETVKRPVQFAKREAPRAPIFERPRDRAPSAPETFKPQKFSSSMVDKLPSRPVRDVEACHTTTEIPTAPGRLNVSTVDRRHDTSELTATLNSEAEADYSQLFLSNSEEMEEPNPARKKWMIIAVVSACAILLLLLVIVPLFHRGSKSVAKQSVQPLPAATNSQPATNVPKPSAQESSAQGKPAATTATQQPTDSQAPDVEVNADAAHVESAVMNDQLNAPKRIQQGVNQQVADIAPPPVNFGAAGLGGSSAMEGVFNGQPQTIVKAAPTKPVAISAGVATGLLIQKTLPIYPTIAKSAKVSGTVELQATISKTGTIKNLHVVNGPSMLRQAAFDAVRNWRYKPYQLNNEPIEVETTVNVIFSIGN